MTTTVKLTRPQMAERRDFWKASVFAGLLCIVGIIVLIHNSIPVAKTELMESRTAQKAILLDDGTVLLVGGYQSIRQSTWDKLQEAWERQSTKYLMSASWKCPPASDWEIFDPTKRRSTEHGSFSSAGVPGEEIPVAVVSLDHEVLVETIDGTFQRCRGGHGWKPAKSALFRNIGAQLVRLKNGSILSADGGSEKSMLKGQIYLPGSDTWSDTGCLVEPRYSTCLVALNDGRALMIGGRQSYYAVSKPADLQSCELYDPATNSWSKTGDLIKARPYCAGIVLPDGRVLVSGGSQAHALDTCEIYDPTTGKCSMTGSLAEARFSHNLVVLKNGLVMAVGGNSSRWGCPPAFTCELYNPQTGLWSTTGSLRIPRQDCTATLLPDGKVLVTGGSGEDNDSLDSCELYDPANGTWSDP